MNKVEAGSPAERHGLCIGEMIMAVNEIPVQDIEDLGTLQVCMSKILLSI